LAFLKDPLKLYINEAEHKFNLNVYSITDLRVKEVQNHFFLKCVNINFNLEDKKHDEKLRGIKMQSNKLTIK